MTDYFKAAAPPARGGRAGPPRDDHRRSERPGKHFSASERQQLRALVAELGQNWEEIADRLGRTQYDCQRQYLCWDSQPEWRDEENERLVALYNEGRSLAEAAQELGGDRSVVGVRAKLATEANRRRLTRPLEEEDDEFPLVFRLVARCEGLIDAARDTQRAPPAARAERARELRRRVTAALELISEQQ